MIKINVVGPTHFIMVMNVLKLIQILINVLNGIILYVLVVETDIILKVTSV